MSKLTWHMQGPPAHDTAFTRPRPLPSNSITPSAAAICCCQEKQSSTFRSAWFIINTFAMETHAFLDNSQLLSTDASSTGALKEDSF
jgi:hypothetical protein